MNGAQVSRYEIAFCLQLGFPAEYRCRTTDHVVVVSANAGRDHAMTYQQIHKGTERRRRGVIVKDSQRS